MSLSPGAANFMNRLIYDPCARPFWVYAATGIPAFLEMWLTVAFLDLEDLVRARGFSESGRDLGKGRRGRRHGGLKMPRGTPGPVTRYAALGTRTLLIATLPLEAIGFTMLLYAATDKFFYRWSSLLENIRCDGEPRTLMRTNSNFGAFPSPAGGAVALPTVLQTTGIYADSTFSTAVPFGAYEVFLTLEIDGITPTNGADYAAGIATTGALGASLRTGPTVFIKAGQGGTVMFSGTIAFPLFSGGTIGWVLVGPQVPVGVQVKKAHVVVYQHGAT